VPALKTGKGRGAVCRRAGASSTELQPQFLAIWSTAAALLGGRACACLLMADAGCGNTHSRAKGAGRDGFSRAGSSRRKRDLAAASKQQRRSLRPASAAPGAAGHRRLLPPRQRGRQAGPAGRRPGRTRIGAGQPHRVRGALTPPAPNQLPGPSAASCTESRAVARPLLPTQPDHGGCGPQWAAKQQHQAETRGIGEQRPASFESINPIAVALLQAPGSGRWRRNPLQGLSFSKLGQACSGSGGSERSASGLWGVHPDGVAGRQSLKLRQLSSPPG